MKIIFQSSFSVPNYEISVSKHIKDKVMSETWQSKLKTLLETSGLKPVNEEVKKRRQFCLTDKFSGPEHP